MILSVYTYLEQVEVVQEKNNRIPARKKKCFSIIWGITMYYST